MTSSSLPALDAFIDQRVPGGCEDCDAYQTVQQHLPNFYLMAVHHDDTCPTYRAMRSDATGARGATGAA